MSLVGLCPRDKFWFISMLGKHTIVHFLPLLLILYCGPFPYWTNNYIVDTFRIELMYCGPFSVLNWHCGHFSELILWTFFHIELIYCGHCSILNYGHFLYWLMYCGPFSVLNRYIVDLYHIEVINIIVDPFPYWTYILWTFFRTELMYCGPFSVLN